MSEVIIDVREKDEFAIEHAQDAINVPLSLFASMAPGILNQLKDRKIVFMCRSGARAAQAQAIANQMGFNDAHIYSVYAGGILQWKKDGNQVVANATNKAPLPLIRQVQIVIGVLVIAFGVLGAAIDPIYSYIAAAIGAGVLIAGATGFCAMATLMGKLPWNRGDVKAQKEMCQASSGNAC